MRGKKNQGAALRFALSAAFALTFVVAFFFPGPRIAYAMDMKAKPSASAPSNATIYFFRLEGLITPYSPDIKVDGRVVGKMPGGTYFVVNRPAGHHTIGIDAGTMWLGKRSSGPLAKRTTLKLARNRRTGDLHNRPWSQCWRTRREN